MNSYIQKHTSAAPLAVFRIAFGTMLLLSTLRFWLKGWIETLYIQPKMFFTFYGFEFVQPLGQYTYLLFAICGISALLVALGWYYRVAIVSLFLSFTYIELIDKTTYLNHYYFVSLITFLLIFLPANTYFSIDSKRNKDVFANEIPLWCVDSLRFFVSILYFYAGLAKINSDWLFSAMPLKIWLPAHNEIPVIGFLLNYSWVHYAFSWFGCLYDLSIPFLLWNKKTRIVGYFLVIIFHLLTSLLFPIGMFPYIMIVTALIFFSPQFHENLISIMRFIFKISNQKEVKTYRYEFPHVVQTLFIGFFVVQLLLPFRYLLYPGELFWTEEGYRFSWRVMLMEKAGSAQFTVVDRKAEKIKAVENEEFLTKMQEKMMATQPDMALQYAHFLRDHFSKNGFSNPEVYVDSYVTLNGRFGKTLIDPKVDLAKETESFKHKKWIVPFSDEIKGL